MKLLNLMLFFIAIQLSVVIFDQHMIMTDHPSIGNQFIGTNYSDINVNSSFYTVANTSDLGSNLTGFWGVLNKFTPLSTFTSASIWGLADFFFGGLSANTFIILIMLLLTYTFSFGLFASRNEMVYISPLAMALLGVAFLPLYNIYILVTRETGTYACGIIDNGVMQSCWFGSIIGLIVVMPLAFTWMFSVLEFWSARSMA